MMCHSNKVCIDSMVCDVGMVYRRNICINCITCMLYLSTEAMWYRHSRWRCGGNQSNIQKKIHVCCCFFSIIIILS